MPLVRLVASCRSMMIVIESSAAFVKIRSPWSMRVCAALEAGRGWLVRYKGGDKSRRSWWDLLPYRIVRIAGLRLNRPIHAATGCSAHSLLSQSIKRDQKIGREGATVPSRRRFRRGPRLKPCRCRNSQRCSLVTAIAQQKSESATPWEARRSPISR